MSDSDDNNSNSNHNQEFPPQSKLSCPVDLSCIWTGPKWAVTSWVSSAAGLLGLNPNYDSNITSFADGGDGRSNGGRGARRRRGSPKYVPLTTSTDSIHDDHDNNNAVEEYESEDDEDDDKVGSNKNNNNNSNIAAIAKPPTSLLAGIAQATFGVLQNQNSISLSPEFEVWQKYIRDLSNFAALDVDVAVLASSSDRASPCPYVHLTIRGPIIPSLGRCRREFDHATSFITPQTEDEWREANPIAVLQVVEAFLLSVVAPETVQDDDTIESIVETGTPILAHPALELQEFLKSVAEFVRQKCLGVKLVIRDVDFTAEFESARQQHAERFLVLDTVSGNINNNNNSVKIIAREARSGGSIVGNMLSAFSGENGDHGCCPPSAVNAFEADYTMLDIVRASRNLIRRLIQNISSLRSIEVRGCLMRDSDLDVNGILAGRSAVLSVIEPNNNNNNNEEEGNTNEGDENRNQVFEKKQPEFSRRSSNTDDDAAGEDEGANRCFPYRSGFVASKLKRVSGPTRLVIEHCGMTDAHVSALIRLLRIESEKFKRNSANGDVSTFSTHFLTSIASLRISGQFLPMTIMGLLSTMQDTFDDSKMIWAKKKQSLEEKRVQQQKETNSSSKGLTCASAEDRSARIPFPLEEVELPNSSVHVVRDGMIARGIGRNNDIVVRSTD